MTKAAPVLSDLTSTTQSNTIAFHWLRRPSAGGKDAVGVPLCDRSAWHVFSSLADQDRWFGSLLCSSQPQAFLRYRELEGTDTSLDRKKRGTEAGGFRS